MIVKMRRSYTWLASTGLLALLLVASISIPTVRADGPPGLPPHQFYGRVTINGAAAPSGTTVQAYVGGALNATTTVDSLGRYGYSPIFTVTGTNGQTVTFYVGGTLVSQTTTYSSGSMTRLDLTSTTTSLALSTSAASSVASSTATLNGNLTNMGGAGSVNVYFQYGLTTSYGSTTSTQTKTSTGTFNAAISSLTPSTTYHYRAVATSGSTTVYGGDVQFTTSVSALSVTTNDATSVATTAATLNGNLNDLGGASSASVYFEYGTTTSYGSTTTAQTKTSIGSFNTAVSSLLSNTTYHFRAVATAGGNTVYGSDKSFTTSTGTLAVTTGSATSISCNSATLNGILSSLGTNSSVNVYFQYGTTTSYGSTTSTQSLSSAGTFSATISGLSPSTTYHFRAVAAGSTTVYGSDSTFTTPSCGGGSTVPPHQFYGRVYIGGALASSGIPVAAYVNGAQTASTTTDSSGRYGYTTLFYVPGTAGGTVTFYVGGTIVPQTATWTSGSMTNLNLVKGASTGPTITTTSLANGTVGTSYSQTLQASGGTPPYSWSIVSGSGTLPLGLNLNSSTGVISGTPTAPNNTYYPFTARVTDSASATADKALSICIGSCDTPPPPGTKLIGADEGASWNYSLHPSYLCFARFQAESSGNVVVFRIRASASGNVKVAIYSDSSGQPGSLLSAVNTSTPVVSGWNSITITSTPVVSGTYYWLAFNSDSQIVCYNNSAPGLTFKNTSTTFSYSSDFPASASGLTFNTWNVRALVAGWAN